MAVAKANLSPADRVARALISVGVPAFKVSGQWIELTPGTIFVVPVPTDASDEYEIPQPLPYRGKDITSGIAATFGDSVYLMGLPRIGVWLTELKRAGTPLRSAPLTLGVMKRLGHLIQLPKAA